MSGLLRLSCRFCASHGEYQHRAVGIGHTGTQGHQGVHIGGTVEKAPGAADKEPLVNHQNDAGKEQLGNSRGGAALLQKCRQGHIPQHPSHGNIHQHPQENQRGNQSGRKVPGGLLRLRGLGLFSALGAGLVAGLFHRRDDFLGGNLPFHRHIPGEQIHRAIRHPRHRPGGLLHPGTAGGAGHALYHKVFHGIPPISSASGGFPSARR